MKMLSTRNRGSCLVKSVLIQTSEPSCIGIPDLNISSQVWPILAHATRIRLQGFALDTLAWLTRALTRDVQSRYTTSSKPYANDGKHPRAGRKVGVFGRLPSKQRSLRIQPCSSLSQRKFERASGFRHSQASIKTPVTTRITHPISLNLRSCVIPAASPLCCLRVDWMKCSRCRPSRGSYVAGASVSIFFQH